MRRLDIMAAADIMLYWGSGSPPCWRAMIVLEEKGLQGYKEKLCNFSNKEHKAEEVLKLNPRGQLPTFRIGDIVINESMAICDYLESVYSNQGTKLIPDECSAKALVLQKKYEVLNLQKKGNEDLLYYFRGTKPEDRKEDVVNAKKEAYLQELKTWNDHLDKMGDGSYLAGKDFSMADVIFYPLLALHVRVGLQLRPRFPNLADYHDRVTKRPSVQATLPPHWKDSPAPSMLNNI